MQSYVGGVKSNYVRGGSSFTAKVSLLNDGTTTWSKSYGFFLSEYNNQTSSNTWNASGNQLSENIAPGQTKTFSLTLKAPAASGKYQFNWAIAIVYQGFVFNTCTGYYMNVGQPPGAFSLSSPSHTASSVALSWSKASGSSGYNVYRGKTLVKKTAGNSFTDGGLACHTTYSYYVIAKNNYGSKTSNTKSVATSNCPTASKPTATSSPSAPLPVIQGSSNTNKKAGPDKTPPGAPSGLTANMNDSGTNVQINWTASLDTSGIKAYQLDRSTDQKNWQTLTSNSVATSYIDNKVSFNSSYYYRLRVVDNAGNKSAYASTALTTPPFAANVSPDQASTVNDDSNNLAVTIPAGAITEPAQCAVAANPTLLPPTIKGYQAVDGPYDLTCKNFAGNDLVPLKAYAISWTTSEASRRGSSTLDYFGYDGANWTMQKVTARDGKNRTDQVEVQGAMTFTAMGRLKHTPLIVKILLVLILLAAVAAIVLFILIRRLRGKQQDRYDDYIHKEYGI